LKETVQAEQAIVRTNNLQKLYKELKTDIKFINKRSALYYNSKRSIGPTLREGDKVYLLRKNIKTARLSDKLDYKKLGLFVIIKVVGPVNYKLKLPKTINIYPVFYISLLEKAPPGAPAALTVEIEPINPEAEYKVERVLDYRLYRGSVQYLIK
jgi:hypothetical protein